MEWNVSRPHDGYEWEEATGNHDYRGLLADGGECGVCQRPWKKSDNALYKLIEDAEGNIIGREPSDPERVHGRPYRACGYDGCIHPEDLHRVLGDPEYRVEVADWKYGWPHKLYIEGPRGFHAKFYNDHLRCVDGDARASLISLIFAHTGVKFEIEDDGRLSYSSGLMR